MVEVGSMEVVGVYKDGGLITNLHVIDSLTKSLKTEYQRMTAMAVTAGEAMADIGKKILSSITAALTSSPYLIGALTKIKTFMMLLAWEISKVLRPALEWLAEKIEEVYRWFKDLNPIVKEVISWLTIAAGIFGLAAIAAKLLGKPLKFLKTVIGFISTKIKILTGYLLSGKVAMLGLWGAAGLLLGVLTVFVLDKLGVLDWFSDLGKRFRDARDDGNLLYDALTVLAGPLALLGDLFLVLVTDKTMEDFWNDVDTVTESLRNLWDALNTLNRPVWDWMKGGLSNLSSSVSGLFSGATGRYVESDMYMKVHAGERIVPANSNTFSNAGGETNIILDFTGTTVNLTSGIDLDDFADTVSRKIADNQAWSSY